MTAPAPVKPEHIAAACKVLDQYDPDNDAGFEATVAQALADAEARVWQRVLDIHEALGIGEVSRDRLISALPSFEQAGMYMMAAHSAVLKAAREAVKP